MDQEPAHYLQNTLKKEINDLLKYQDEILFDYEIPVAPDKVMDLDVQHVIVNRNVEKRRTLCHVQRPATDEHYWRHDTFVAWDDGRTAFFQINISPTAMERSVLQALPAADQALKGELDRLVYHNVIEASAAQTMLQMILAGVAHIKDEVDEALLKQDELDEETDMERIIKTILETVDTHLTLDQSPHSDFNHLYAVIRRLRKAQFDAMVVREQISARYYQLHNQYMEYIEADPASTAEPAAAWNLLELLDRIR